MELKMALECVSELTSLRAISGSSHYYVTHAPFCLWSLSNYCPLFVQSNPGFRACLLFNLWWKFLFPPAAPFQVLECVCSSAWGCPLASPHTAFSLLLSLQSAFHHSSWGKRASWKAQVPCTTAAACLCGQPFSFRRLFFPGWFICSSCPLFLAIVSQNRVLTFLEKGGSKNKPFFLFSIPHFIPGPPVLLSLCVVREDLGCGPSGHYLEVSLCFKDPA